MYILRAFAFLLFLTQVVLAQQPAPILPDPKLTPGDNFDVTAQDVCNPRMPEMCAMFRRKRSAKFTGNTASHLMEHGTGDYEIDHLISLELGGSNSIRSLWPESYRPSRPGANELQPF